MTDQMRDMIAQLMGTDNLEGKERPGIPYDHPNVCRAYLLGICPHDLVPDSRLQSVVSCRKVHEPAHKADFVRAQRVKDHFYDVDAYEILEYAVHQVDIEVAKVREKLEDDVKLQSNAVADSKAAKISELEEKIAANVIDIEKLGNEGKIEESMRLHKLVEEMREQVNDIINQTEFKVAGPGSNAAKLRVCEDCGAQLNIMDHETRIADHYNGKMHIGMVETRETYLRMKETIEDRRNERSEKLGSRYSSNYSFNRHGGGGGRSDRDRRDRGDYSRRGGGDRRRSRSRSRSRDRANSYRSGGRDDRRYNRDDRNGGRDRRDDRRDRRY
ncbi:unnamed protein product [Caenorhabditis angaria]|uniref:Uncharacterized protein n=1 Tax=Caenorhabditis angaria TaxID=860376 RepID=A0A9P1MWB7_9PELO|nr:unnamed protein product [Caenorhabditis angaria]